uniref:BACK domain-containing protein n=1 Tax=Tetranychus urticae TaxID=32264 RepID=T1JY89_TETUR
MNSLEMDDQLTIINRSKEHRVNKQLIRGIPYFEKMLSHGCLESKENKVVLDLDENAFKLFLIWLEFDGIFIEMDNVINLCNISDYFGMDHLIQDCLEYFRIRFSIEHLPLVIPQVTETSILINSDTLNAFICRHFLKIANTAVWLNYPVETIEYICTLDLMIYSEMQVFEAIASWVDFNADSRKCHLARLLRLVRWCHLKEKDLFKIKENGTFESSGFEPKSCLPTKHNCDCISDRSLQNCFIIIEKLEGTDLRITVLDSNFLFLFNRDMKLDESISLNLFHDEHVSDIFYHSGSKAIRIDWNQNKYRFFKDTDFRLYVKKYWRKPLGFWPFYRCTIRDTTDSRLINTHGHEEFEYWLSKLMQTTNEIMKNSRLHHWLIKLRVTVLSNNIFILTNNLEFGKFNVPDKHFKKIELPKLAEEYAFKYESLFLTSSVDDADRVFLTDKSTKNVFCFNITNQEWSLIGHLLQDSCVYPYSKWSSDYSRDESNKLITLTPALLPLQMIITCLNHNLNSVR